MTREPGESEWVNGPGAHCPNVTSDRGSVSLMATKTQIKEQARLDALLAEAGKAFEPIKSKVVKAANAYTALEKKATVVRVELGNVAALMMTALSVPTFPEADRETVILRYLDSLGCRGFSFATIKSWGAGFHTYKVLPPELRDLPLYTLIDLSRIPTDPSHATGGRVAVAAASVAAGNKTDDEHRKFIRDARRKASGWTPPKDKTVPELAVAIADKSKVTPPVLTPETDGTYRVTFEDLVAVGCWAVATRETGGSADMRAYRLVIETALHPPTTVVVASGNGEPENDTADEAAAIEAAEAASK